MKSYNADGLTGLNVVIVCLLVVAADEDSVSPQMYTAYARRNDDGTIKNGRKIKEKESVVKCCRRIGRRREGVGGTVLEKGDTVRAKTLNPS